MLEIITSIVYLIVGATTGYVIDTIQSALNRLTESVRLLLLLLMKLQLMMVLLDHMLHDIYRLQSVHDGHHHFIIIRLLVLVMLTNFVNTRKRNDATATTTTADAGVVVIVETMLLAVSVEIGSHPESFAASVANVRLLSRMNRLVHAQIPHHLERFTTVRADCKTKKKE